MDIMLNYHFCAMRKWRLVNMPLEKQIIANELAFAVEIVGARVLHYALQTSALAAH